MSTLTETARTLMLDNGDDAREAITLVADDLDPRGWNGFAVPYVTAANLRDYVARQARNDPNGEWSGMTITETSDGHDATLTITYDDRDADEADRLDSNGVADDGRPTYRLDGWTWMHVDPAAAAAELAAR